MSRLRSRLVNTRSLARIARHLQLGPHLRLGRGEDETGGRDRNSNLADATEAILGAVYRDGGFTAAKPRRRCGDAAAKPWRTFPSVEA